MNFYMHESGKLWQTEIPKDANLAVALGCFDGVHLGHKALLTEIIRNSDGLVSAIWTFSEPLTKPYIERVEDRIKLCARFGVKFAICESFERFRNLSPAEFILHLSNLNVKKIVCGLDYRFGKDRVGDINTLKEESEKYGITVTVVPSVYTHIDGEQKRISSTMIRTLITEGKVDKAAELLGRPFTVSGVIVSGNNLGRTIQVPTLNQRFEKGRIVPKHGVYATTCLVDGKSYPSITNIGTRPTVASGSHEENCETHIIGQKLDLYGEIAAVQFNHYVRPEQKFNSLEELRQQIARDIEYSSNFFKNS